MRLPIVGRRLRPYRQRFEAPGLAPADEGHRGSHHREKKDVRGEWQASHERHSPADVSHIHRGFVPKGTVGLFSPLEAQVSTGRRQGISNVDLPTRYVVRSTLQGTLARKAGDGMLGRGIGSHARTGRMSGDRAVVDYSTPSRRLPLHGLERFASAKKGARDVGGHNRLPFFKRDVLEAARRRGDPSIIEKKIDAAQIVPNCRKQ